MTKPKLTITDLLLLTVFTLVFIWFYIGFYFPDPYTLHKFSSRFITPLILTIRILLPAVWIGIIALYWSVRTKKIPVVNVVLLGVTGGVCLAGCYVIGLYLYNTRGGMAKKIQDYHPYLQLMPSSMDTADSDGFSVLCLGGSTTEFTSDGKGWPKRVEERIRRQTGNNTIVFHNQGRQWYTTLHTLINYQTNIRKHKPDMIIVMHAINDLLHNADQSYFSTGPFRDDYGHFPGPVIRLVRGGGFLKEVFGSIRLWYHKPRTVVHLTEFRGLDAFIRNYNTLIDCAEHDSVKVVLMTQPYLFKETMSEKELRALHMVNVETYGPATRWHYTSALRGMESYNRATKEIARQRGIPVIDLDAFVPKSMEYFYDDVHYTKQAFDHIADAVAKELLSRHLLATVPRFTTKPDLFKNTKFENSEETETPRISFFSPPETHK